MIQPRAPALGKRAPEHLRNLYLAPPFPQRIRAGLSCFAPPGLVRDGPGGSPVPCNLFPVPYPLLPATPRLAASGASVLTSEGLETRE
jgi:hypothetical protein